MRKISKMGGIGSLMGMLPGMGGMKKQLEAAKDQINDRAVARQLAIISSMTPLERSKPELLKASRKQRVAKGSGTSVQDVNKLLKQFQGMAKMMKQVSKQGKRGLMPQLPSEWAMGDLAKLGNMKSTVQSLKKGKRTWP